MTASSLFATGDSRDSDQSNSDGKLPSVGVGNASFGSTSSLYRKYRPQSFADDELVGQEHIVRTLRNAIALDRVAHAYLFCGPRGTGKTTTARLLAKAVNCLDPDPALRPCNRCASCLAINSGSSPDIIEIDAASNRGIDDIRDLRERTRFAPAQLRSKVYIIDEAHQITGAAANAFLKTLEEPPAHSRFILATTDPEELLPTIVSRCQQFEFRRVSVAPMARRLRTVVEREQIMIADDALDLIARNATGSLRDALGLLEQLALRAALPGADAASNAVIGVDDVRAALGLSRNERIEDLVTAVAQRNVGEAVRIVQDAVDDGEDPRQLNRQLVAYLRLLLLERSGSKPETDEKAQSLAAQFSLAELASLARRFGEIDFTIKHSPFSQLPLEVAIVEATAIVPAQLGASPESTVATNSQLPVVHRPSPLRDRIRRTAPEPDSPNSSAISPARAEPSPITPIRPSTSAIPKREFHGEAGSSLDVEQIANLWPDVRADVKALNRRIEALLSEVDPVAISGNQITLAVPYPFHRDKLNSDDVRETLSSVLSRRLNRDVSILCILREEMTSTRIGAAQIEPSPAKTGVDNAPSDEDERAMARLRAAKNIFDAEEIDASDLGISMGDIRGR